MSTTISEKTYTSKSFSPISIETMLFHSAIAAKLGLNSTDHKCLIFLFDGPKTASELAAYTGLTPGAQTAALVRLENAGFIRRKHDTQDRRRVFVEVAPENLAAVAKLFIPLGEAVAKLESEYSAEQLALIHAYEDKTAAILREERMKLSAS
ncbi:MAG TPA: MarR family transcriptional regulator [Candidatus Saccharimonadales bacterium]|nr:MarR family transcriptional regulator [Candidatus Saccharimonadales bacterium]